MNSILQRAPWQDLGALVYLVPEPQLRPFLQEDVGVEGRLLGGS